MTDVTGKIRQYKPILLLQKVADTIIEHNKKSEPVKLQLGEIDFSRINLDYRNEAQNMDAALRLGNFHTQADSIDLAKLHIRIKQIALNNTQAVVRFGKIKTAQIKKQESSGDTSAHTESWSLDIARFTIDSTRLAYDDNTKQAIKKGMDYNHLNVNHLTVHTSNLHADPSNYQAIISVHFL